MSQGASRYPVSQFLLDMLGKTGLDRNSFIRSLGYRNLERGLRRLDAWMDSGAGYALIIKQISDAYPDHADGLAKAITDTTKLRAVESAALFLERCKAEESTFVPFIHAEGDSRIPMGITIFGITGGHHRWTTIHIPKAILELSLEDQLTMLPTLMAAYRRKFNGACPFLGKLTGFKFVRLLDYFQFDSEGNFVEHVEKPFRTGYVEVSLR